MYIIKMVWEVGECVSFSGSHSADHNQSLAEMISLCLAEIKGTSVCKLKRLRDHFWREQETCLSSEGDWNAAAKELRSCISLHSTFNAELPLAEAV